MCRSRVSIRLCPPVTGSLPSYSELFDLPTTIKTATELPNVCTPLCLQGVRYKLTGQVEAWAREHLHLIHSSDMALALLLQTGAIIRPYHALRSTKLPSHVALRVYDDIASLVRQVRRKWFDTERELAWPV